MASAAGPVGGSREKDEIADVDLEVLKPSEEAAERPVGLKRAWRSAIGNGSYGINQRLDRPVHACFTPVHMLLVLPIVVRDCFEALDLRRRGGDRVANGEKAHFLCG